MSLNVPEKGAYRFELNASNTASPTLTVSPLGPLGVEVFLRGSMNDWSATDRLRYAGENRYHLETKLAAGNYEFKIGDATWNIVNIGAPEADQDTVSLDKAKNLARGKNPANLKISLPAEGRYRLTLETENPDAPTLIISTD
jgi:hypothetical protein